MDAETEIIWLALGNTRAQMPNTR